MGIRIDPPPFEFGTDCPTCTPSPWPPGKTPMYVFAFFSGIINCGVSPHPAPNGETFLLQQDPLQPCRWMYEGNYWTVFFEPRWDWPDRSRVLLLDHHGFSFFVGYNEVCEPEMIRFVNAQNECFFMWAGAGGFCIIDWSGSFLAVIDSLGIERYHLLMRESRYVDDTDIVLKACNVYQRTNFKFKMKF